jgi:hypothetical protein
VPIEVRCWSQTRESAKHWKSGGDANTDVLEGNGQHAVGHAQVARLPTGFRRPFARLHKSNSLLIDMPLEGIALNCISIQTGADKLRFLLSEKVIMIVSNILVHLFTIHSSLLLQVLYTILRQKRRMLNTCLHLNCGHLF